MGCPKAGELAEEIEIQGDLRMGCTCLRDFAADNKLNCPQVAELYDMGPGDLEMVSNGNGDLLWSAGN